MSENAIIKIKFILIYAAMVWLAYFAVYLEDNGYSGSQIGVLYGIYQTTLFFVVIIWGFLSDKFGVRRIFVVVTMFASVMLMLLPSVTGYQFLLAYVFFMSVFVHPGPPLLEGISIHYSHSKQKGTFGSYRLFGAVGWGIASPLLGNLIDNTHSGIIFPYAGLFLLIVSALGLILLRMDKQLISGANIRINGIGYFFRGPFLYFLIILFLFGFCMAPISHVISLYYREIGASNVLIGIAFTIQTIVEIPFFFFGIHAVRKFGAAKTISFSIFIGIIRLLFYGMTTNPYIAVFGGILQGFTLSLFVISVVDYIQNNIGALWRSTGQTFIWAFHFGAGFAIGNFWLGALKTSLSMNEIMIVQAAINMVVFILALVYFKKAPLDKKLQHPVKN